MSNTLCAALFRFHLGKIPIHLCILFCTIFFLPQVKRRMCGRGRACVRSCHSGWQPATVEAAQMRQGQQMAAAINSSSSSSSTATFTTCTIQTGQGRRLYLHMGMLLTD